MRSILSFMVLTFIVVILSHTELRGLQAQNEALLEWKASLDKQSQSTLVSWDRNNSCRSWFGISCSNSPPSEFVVTDISLGWLGLTGSLDTLNFSSFRNLEFLDLSLNNLSGSIPSNIANLSQLRILNLGWNDFSGVIPSEIGMLPLLETLYLFQNRLTGHIPNSIANLTKLTDFVLSVNDITGSIPHQISPKLEYLDFSFNNLVGEIPNSLGNLTHLHILHLDRNYLSGTIPSELGRSKDLMNLWICYNNLTGPIPDSFRNFTRLDSLWFSSNNFSGSFPKDINLSKITIFSVDNNKLSGPLPRVGKLVHTFTANNNLFSGGIPLEIGNLSSLETLDLSGNQLSGPIPDTILHLTSLQYLNLDDNMFNGTLPGVPINIVAYSVKNNRISGELPFGICISRFLEILHLSNNNISGALPDCFMNSSSLTSLNLNRNRLQGLVPKSLINCTLLEVLDLGNNMITEMFPHWLDDLPNLKVLVMNSNKLHGTIESSSSKLPFPKLQILDLSGNLFTGRLPSKYFENFKAMMNIDEGKRMPTYIGGKYKDSVVLVVKGLELKYERILTVLTTIDLSDNKFEGGIPNNIQKLNSLRYLNLSHNHLTGQIPAMLDNLTKLESLDLSTNQVQGKIPAELTRLTFLVVFNVSDNQLSGTIPRGQQFNTFGNDSYLKNFGLCGFPLTHKCGVDEESTQFQKQQEDDISGFFDGFTWESVVLGYGCGIALGVGLGCLMFSTGKPIWVMKIVNTLKRRKRPEICQFAMKRN